MSCARLRSVHVPSGHRSVTPFVAVARTGRSIRCLTTRETRATSAAALKQGYRQAFIGRLSQLLADRAGSMPFRRSPMLWLAGTAIISAVAAQSVYATVSTIVKVSKSSATAFPNTMRLHAGLAHRAHRASVLIIRVNRTNSNKVNREKPDEKPCQPHYVLSSGG